MKYAYSQNERVEATPKAQGICICCGSEMIAKCGNQKIWHWSHKNRRQCDIWWENETEWHRNWKDKFPKEWQEVVHFAEDGEKHIADVKTPRGLVVEFQHSRLKYDELRSRENFYRDLIWVVDGTRLKSDFEKFDWFKGLVPWRKWKYGQFYSPNLPPKFFPSYNLWQHSNKIVIFDWGYVRSEYWIDDWHSHLVGMAPQGWFVMARDEFVNRLKVKKGLFAIDSRT